MEINDVLTIIKNKDPRNYFKETNDNLANIIT